MPESERRTPRTPPRLRRTSAWLALAAAALLLLLELAAAVGVETGLLTGVARPGYGRASYGQGDHPQLGVWRRPNAEFEHRSPCVQVRYRSNSVGARDVERTPTAEAPRVVVLGDSFMDGWGVRDDERLSGLLETQSGVEHLNFAMPHFGPYQALLAYRHLARSFEHDAVLLGILPANDFADSDPALASSRAGYEYRYRPYLVGDAPPYEHVQLREPAWLRGLRGASYAANAALRALSEWRARASPPPFPAASEAARREPSWFYDYPEAAARRLEWIVRALVREAEGRAVAVILIPVADDYRRQQISGPSPLASRLEALAAREGFQLVDLLSTTAAEERGSQSYFHACDYHWNARGNQVAARQVLAALGESFYAPLRARRERQRATGASEGPISDP